MKPNINDLSRLERKQFMRQLYRQSSYFMDTVGDETKEMDLSGFAQEFRDHVVRLLIDKGVIETEVPLENLHESISDEMRAYDFDYGVNKVSTFFYETDAPFLKTYHRFVSQALDMDLFSVPMWFQATPTIRIHCPYAKNSHHYPRYHTDVGYGHPPEEINVWIPLTKKQGGHSFRLCSMEQSRQLFEMYDYDIPDFIDSAIHSDEFTARAHQLSHPVETNYGKALLFDSRCIHSGEPMKEHTRVSIDLRVTPLEAFSSSPYVYQGTGRRKILFAPGHCYSSMSTKDLREVNSQNVL